MVSRGGVMTNPPFGALGLENFSFKLRYIVSQEFFWAPIEKDDKVIENCGRGVGGVFSYGLDLNPLFEVIYSDNKYST